MKRPDGSCDTEYIKNEITFVNYIRDRNEAHVHVLITTQSTGSGGRGISINFQGLVFPRSRR